MALPNAIPNEATFNPGSATDAVAAESSSHRGAVVKKLKDHKEINTDSCGLLREVLATEDNLPLTLVIADDIKPTKGHYHLNFKEIYFVLDGWLNLKFFDPATGQYWEESVTANEVCIIDKSIHHVVTGASAKNRLCVIAVPGYSDETMSDKL
jgi:oxalate decarboxylase/phosphoglucose isomerase-like protein (cupin superfamily)